MSMPATFTHDILPGPPPPIDTGWGGGDDGGGAGRGASRAASFTGLFVLLAASTMAFAADLCPPDARPLRRQRRALPDAALPRADRRVHANRAATRREHRAHGAPGAGGRAGGRAIPAHQLARRSAGTATEES